MRHLNVQLGAGALGFSAGIRGVWSARRIVGVLGPIPRDQRNHFAAVSIHARLRMDLCRGTALLSLRGLASRLRWLRQP